MSGNSWNMKLAEIVFKKVLEVIKRHLLAEKPTLQEPSGSNIPL